MNCILDPCHHLGVGGRSSKHRPKTLLEQRFFLGVAEVVVMVEMVARGALVQLTERI